MFAVGDVSTRLRRARERRGLRIEDISARTKIKPRFIGAIEAADFETLPGHFFTRAFLKAYAREVGLSPQEIVRQFDLVHTGADPVPLPGLAAAVAQNPRPHTPRPALAWRMPNKGLQMAAIFAVTLGVLAALNNSQESERAAQRTTAPVAAAPADATDAAPAVGTSGEAVPDKLTIDIHPTGVIWVAATADGATAVYKLLQPGQTVSIAGRDFSFRIGNAAAFAYAINGVPGKPLGGADEVREFQITMANYRGYIR